MSNLVKLKILSDAVASCTQCDLHVNRLNTVFSRGNPESKLMIVAEAPGQTESETGFPLVGAAGKLLDKAFLDLGLDSNNDSYVTNIIKCRPPNNRKPTDIECNTCLPYLEEQIKLVEPKIILALGNTAIYNLTPTTLGVSKLRGQLLKYKNISVLCTWHPSYVLRNGSSGPVYDDFVKDLKAAIDKSKE